MGYLVEERLRELERADDGAFLRAYATGLLSGVIIGLLMGIEIGRIRK